MLCFPTLLPFLHGRLLFSLPQFMYNKAHPCFRQDERRRKKDTMSRMTVEELLQTPYWIIDILPCQVPADSPGQYFDAAAYWRKEPQRTAIKQRQIDLILKLNCYRSISLDEGKTLNPSPDRIAEAIRKEWTGILLDDALITSDPEDHNMTLYNPDEQLLMLVRTLAAGEGFYVWRSENE